MIPYFYLHVRVRIERRLLLCDLSPTFPNFLNILFKFGDWLFPHLTFFVLKLWFDFKPKCEIYLSKIPYFSWLSSNVRRLPTSMDLKAQRQSLVRPHFALTKPGAMRLGPWMWARILHDSTSSIIHHGMPSAPLSGKRAVRRCPAAHIMYTFFRLRLK